MCSRTRPRRSQSPCQALREVLSGYEAGESVFEVRVGPWSELHESARHIRTEVFVDEQKVPLEMEWDDADETALHAVAFNRIGQAVATGRLLPAEKGFAKIGRVATNRFLRGSG